VGAMVRLDQANRLKVVGEWFVDNVVLLNVRINTRGRESQRMRTR